jgi:hypothetical protein
VVVLADDGLRAVEGDPLREEIMPWVRRSPGRTLTTTLVPVGSVQEILKTPSQSWTRSTVWAAASSAAPNASPEARSASNSEFSM